MKTKRWISEIVFFTALIILSYLHGGCRDSYVRGHLEKMEEIRLLEMQIKDLQHQKEIDELQQQIDLLKSEPNSL
jgi:hypothetical protein